MAKRISVNEGRSETIRRAGGPSGGRAVVWHANRTSSATGSLRNTIPPAREPTGGANADVSWLRAHRFAFPGYPSGVEPITACPLQWRGRAGFAPASVSPFAD